MFGAALRLGRQWSSSSYQSNATSKSSASEENVKKHVTADGSAFTARGEQCTFHLTPMDWSAVALAIPVCVSLYVCFHLFVSVCM